MTSKILLAISALALAASVSVVSADNFKGPMVAPDRTFGRTGMESLQPLNYHTDVVDLKRRLPDQPQVTPADFPEVEAVPVEDTTKTFWKDKPNLLIEE